MLRNDGVVVKLFCFSEWNGVFFNAVIGDGGVWKPCCRKGLLPVPGKDAVEACAESHIKDVYILSAGCLEQMLQSVFDVNVLCLGVCSVAGVVCFVEAGELQGGAPVAACCNVVFHLCARCSRLCLFAMQN